METFTIAVTDGRTFEACGYCGQRRQITARARITGNSNVRNREGASHICRLCMRKGDAYLQSAFAPQRPGTL